jgi:hypothetical protein
VGVLFDELRVGIDVLGVSGGVLRWRWRWDDGRFCCLAWENREWKSAVGAEDEEETSTLRRIGCWFGIS